MAKSSTKSLPQVTPEDAGFSAERLARIQPAMQKYIDTKKVPNIIGLVMREGKIVHFEAQGYLDLDTRELAPKDTIYRLYSNSKPVAGAAVMILFEEGRLNLDDPVSKYIPAFKNPVVISNSAPVDRAGPPSALRTVPAKREITIRDCLRNTTGLATPQRSPFALISQYHDDIVNSG